MYTTCLFCHSALGWNETIEAFPVGRRLAFDAAQGRLWVICRKCERWNLTPMDERWEAVEQCERMFTSTRLRVSTDNIGLSRMRDGLELVRIGSPQRPEMAAWRYGDQFGRRRARYMATTLALSGVAAGILIAGPVAGVGIMAGGGYGAFQLMNAGFQFVRGRRVRTRVAVPGHERPAVLRGKDMKRIVLTSDGDDWSLRLPYNTGVITSDEHPNAVTVTGADALRAASSILPALNIKGAKKEHVNDAVKLIEATPNAHEMFVKAAVAGRGLWGAYNAPQHRRAVSGERGRSEIFLDRLPHTVALALEMAAHEDIERRSMEGELNLLERAWREAEEIASISDAMLLPKSVDEEFEAMKR